MCNIRYGSNYNKIFEDYSLEIDKQISIINKFDIYSSSESSSKIDHGDENNKLFQDNSFVNSIGHNGQGNENFLSYQLNNISSLANFDIFWSSSLSSLSNQNHFFWPILLTKSAYTLERLALKWKRLKVSVK